MTGAGSGIGRATAHLLQTRGARLVLVDRRAEALNRVREELVGRGAEVLAHAVDVSDRAALSELARELGDTIGPLDVLVNNAGVLTTGGFERTSLEEYDRVLDVNLKAVIHSVKLFAPAMRARGRGAIVNVASASGVVGFSLLNAYSTSKFAVVGFSAALGAELRSSGVSVTCVCPGLVQTDIALSAPLDAAERQGIESLLARRGLTAERVAAALVRGVERRTPLVHVGAQARVLAWLARLSPARAAGWLTALSR